MWRLLLEFVHSSPDPTPNVYRLLRAVPQAKNYKAKSLHQQYVPPSWSYRLFKKIKNKRKYLSGTFTWYLDSTLTDDSDAAGLFGEPVRKTICVREDRLV